MKKLLLILLSGFILQNITAQPSITWQHSYGGSDHEYAWKTIPTSDGGYAFVGFSDSNDGDVLSQNNGGTDLWVAKTNASGTVQWSYLYGGTGDDEGADILQNSDGSYMVVGYTESSDGDVTGHHGTSSISDVWVLKLTSSGTLSWNKCYGGSQSDDGVSIAKTQSGDYYVAGTTSSNDGDVSGNHALYYGEFWVFKINALGTLLNQKCIGGTQSEECYRMRVTSDDGCILAGRTSSSDGDALGYHGGSDMLIAKLSASFGVEWSKCYGGTETEECNDIVQLSDGSFIALGYTSTHNNGDISGHHGSQGSDDFWLLKLTSNGSITWAKCFGGDGDDQANGLTKTLDGGFVMCGLTNSMNGDVSGFHSGGLFDPDVWVAKVNAAGTFQWQRCCGGSGQDESFNVTESTNNHFIVTGFTYSSDYDITVNLGSADGWIFELDGINGLEENQNTTISIYPNPFKEQINFAFPINSNSPEKITICDVFGKQVKVISQTTLQNNNSINSADLPSGIYFIELRGADYSFIKKIVKE